VFHFRSYFFSFSTIRADTSAILSISSPVHSSVKMLFTRRRKRVSMFFRCVFTAGRTPIRISRLLSGLPTRLRIPRRTSLSTAADTADLDSPVWRMTVSREHGPSFSIVTRCESWRRLNCAMTSSVWLSFHYSAIARRRRTSISRCISKKASVFFIIILFWNSSKMELYNENRFFSNKIQKKEPP